MKAVTLLRAAGALYDQPGGALANASKSIHGFGGGAEWMRLALGVIRGCAPEGGRDVSFRWLGLAKYCLAAAAFILVAVAGGWLGIPWWGFLPPAVAAFYATEVQFVFLFPLALDGHRRPWSASLGMTRILGTLNAMSCVLPLAAVMLGGGWLGRGFVRCWCLGCLAVVLWYEEQRKEQREIEMRVERVRVEGGPLFRLLWVSDLHLTWRNQAGLSGRLLRTARRAKPDLIVLGGDLVEGRSCLPNFQRLLSLLARVAPTHLIPGNHDAWVGLESLRTAAAATPAIWHDAPGFALKLDGQAPLVFAHDPKHLSGLASSWLAAFAGHLHGGQVVLWRWKGLEYPGAWLSKWNGPRFELSQGAVFVSRGVTDTLPIRWNCPKEVILCEVS